MLRIRIFFTVASDLSGVETPLTIYIATIYLRAYHREVQNHRFRDAAKRRYL
jgi:hypothetical protein